MKTRRKISSDVSAAVLEYVLKSTKMSQEQIAESLEASPAFISRVRSRERSFTIEHLTAVAELMQIPLGALLLAAVPWKKPTAKTRRLHELARQAITVADEAVAAIAGHKN